ncbi:hypothetical protein CAPTEDRAFT_225194 [Capitella teleta]|uniref:Nuclear receptor coactivator 4 N-terminal domain-containing protein n=1 Tax=Capitella teleta TaxID=283909 RepID=R7VJV4_CAPTE|nr:hypothetical protein CAPTEDRAFT_225194 [Capitella teleta]|eukprot:ELU16816.1 hypothetical protein CAPTEDRAFT_225194 [Capitella teleta]
MSGNSTESASSLQARISHLMEAIGKVAALKRALKQNAMEVKSEIQSSVSRQLEWLRSRELHLLEQVELIQAAKEELLSQRQDSLHQALGGLHSSFEGDCKVAPPVDLFCDECPCIRFHADAAPLRESIRDFGRVDSAAAIFPTPKMVSPLEAFPPSHLGTAASLPKPFEDYDDDEHHVLYKTVDNGSNTSILVNVPRLSPAALDWLSVPSDPPAPSSPSAETRFIFPPFQKSEVGQQWLSKGIDGSDNSCGSLQQWLLDLQDQATLEEEEGFEMLSPASHNRIASVSSSDIEVLSLSAFSKGQLDPEEMFEVKSLSGVADKKMTEDSEIGTEMEYFKKVSSDINHWLLQEPSTQASCSNTCQHVQAVPKMKSVDIENLDDLLCVTPVQYPAWKLTETKEDEDRDVDEGAIGEVCRANEVCSTFKDCVCDDNCADTTQEWLQTPKTPEQRDELLASPLRSYMVWMAQQQWLQVHDEVEVEESPVYQYFENLAQESTDRWLMKATQEEAKNPWLLCQHITMETCCDEEDLENQNFDIQKSEANKWLMSSKQVEEVVDEENKLCRSLKESWLLGSDTNDEEMTKRFSFKRSPSFEKAKEMPEYADSEKEIDHEELFLCFKKALAKTELDGWLVSNVL